MAWRAVDPGGCAEVFSEQAGFPTVQPGQGCLTIGIQRRLAQQQALVVQNNAGSARQSAGRSGVESDPAANEQRFTGLFERFLQQNVCGVVTDESRCFVTLQDVAIGLAGAGVQLLGVGDL